MLCTINNQTAYTDDAKVKITKENYMVKNRQTWSMNITFPLAIPENRAVFGHVNRIDVLKRKTTFPNCRLYAANKLVIAGKGTVTEFTETAVKLQIKSGKDEYRYDRYAPSYFIDKLDYGSAEPDPLLYFTVVVEDQQAPTFIESPAPLEGEQRLLQWLQREGGKYTYVPIFDKSKGIVLNQPCFRVWWTSRQYHEDTHSFTYEWTYSPCIARPAVQPNLWHVVQTCIERLGYTFSAAQSQVYQDYRYVAIANPRQTRNIADALPHWSIQRLLDEVENLFNVTFDFNEDTRVCSVTDNLTRDSMLVEVVNEDDFTATYEEEGLKEIMSSDIAFNLSDEHVYSDISDNILEKFEVTEYASWTEAVNAFNAMTDSQRLRNILAYPKGFITGEKWITTDPETQEEVVSVTRKEIGQLQHIRRSEGESEGEDDSSASAISLNLAPVYIEQNLEVEQDTSVNINVYRGALHIGDWFQHTPVPEEPEETVDADENTVTGMLEGETYEQEEAERLEIFIYSFDPAYSYHPGKAQTSTPAPDNEFFENLPWIYLPMGYTFALSMGQGPWLAESLTSLALNRDVSPNILGRYHAKSRKVENRIQLVAKFLYNGIPDPTATYVFAGKRYLCEKIEIEIEADRILPLKTGYFYEIL